MSHSEFPEQTAFSQALSDYYSIVTADPAKAQARVHQLAKQAKEAMDNGDGEAAYWLGMTYYYGLDPIFPDQSAGLEAFERASALGHIRAKTTLADLMMDGTSKNYPDAIALLNSAADGGDLYAQCRLAELVYQGKGCQQDLPSAWGLINELAEGGSAYACLVAGTWYYNDWTKESSAAKAFLSFQRGLDVFDPLREEIWIQSRLYYWTGFCLYNGTGIDANRERGRMLIEKAALFGDADAMQWNEVSNDPTSPSTDGFAVMRPKIYDHIRANPKSCPSCVSFIVSGKADELMQQAVGWDHPKQFYKRIVRLAALQKSRKLHVQGVPHFIMSGPRGSGRHYYAKILARKLEETGYLDHGHVVTVDLADIMTRDRRSWGLWPYTQGESQWVGAVSDKAQTQLFMSALEDFVCLAQGGILIIKDSRRHESSDNVPDSAAYEQQIVRQILELMDDKRNSFVVCLYENEGENNDVHKLLKKNPELASYFRLKIPFAHFNQQELVSLYRKNIEKAGFTLPKELEAPLESEFGRRIKKGDPWQLNNRLVRDLVFDTIDQWAARNEEPVDDRKIQDLDLPRMAPAMAQDDIERLLESLNELTGLQNVKQEVRQLVSFLKARQGSNTDMPALHFVFTGAPGTGKTTVARLMGRILHGLGYLSKGHVVETDGTSLVGKYIGSTPALMREKIEEADGGILFIDEAYTLGQNTLDSYQDKFREEAIAVLLKHMEDRRGRFIVIAAGYSKEMIHFIEANSGLKSRFTRFIEFENFKADEVSGIFEGFCRQGGYKPDQASLVKLHAHVKSLQTIDQINAFGNGRGARTIYEKAIIRQAHRITGMDAWGTPEEKIIVADDIQLAGQTTSRPAISSNIDMLLKPLNDLVGLDDIKEKIQNLAYLSQSQVLRTAKGLPRAPIMLHSIFSGPPGTGKTTVARLLGAMLADMGYLSKGHVVEVAKGSMVGQWLGHTPKIVEQKVNLAAGGILFIDEAYALADNQWGNEYGHEALTTLLKLMEDRRDDFIVVAAGYKKEMDRFLKANSGLQSRFPFSMEFKSYTVPQLVQIIDGLFNQHSFYLTDQARDRILQVLQTFDNEKIDKLGNGRLVRNIFEASMAQQAKRIVRNAIDDERLSVIEAIDIVFPKDEDDEKRIGFL